MRKLLFKKSTAVFLITLLALLYSCKFFFAKTRPAKIQIKKGDPTDGSLVLKDWTGIFSAEHFKVRAGRTIRWVQKAREIDTITNIYMTPNKPNNQNVFSVLPHAISGTPDWEGTVDSGAASKDEDYTIDWIDKAGNPHSYDPYIQVKPQ
jgi:hypothetical protein